MPVNVDPEQIEIEHLRAFGELADANVLEIGCGDARMTKRYIQQTNSIIGVDPDFEELSGAFTSMPQEVNPKAAFAQAMGENLPFRSETFDGVIFAWSF